MPWALPRVEVRYNGDMPAVVLGWDPDRGTRWVPPYERALALAATEGTTTTSCRLADPAPPVGTTVHLMLQGRLRGMVGHGTVRSGPFRSADPGHPGLLATYVLVEWDHLLPVEDRIGPEELSARVPEVAWDAQYGSTTLTEEQADRLERVWRAPHPSARPGRSRLARLAPHVPHVPHVAGPGNVLPGLGGLHALHALGGLAARLMHR